MRDQILGLGNVAAALLLASTAAIPQDFNNGESVVSAHPNAVDYVPLAGFPKGTDISILKGDPETGPFEMYLRLQPGTTVPMHFHTAAERAVGIYGTFTVTYADGTEMLVQTGNYMYVPSKTPHAVTCDAGLACVAYFHFDKAFDVTWVYGPPPNPNPAPGEP